MTLAELKTKLKDIGYPVSYSHFKEKQTPPFIVYLFVDDDDFKADNINYASISNVDIELYTSIKDEAAEKKIEDLLRANDIAFLKNETWIDEEKIFQITYSIQII
jgi:hypothetical protein